MPGIVVSLSALLPEVLLDAFPLLPELLLELLEELLFPLLLLPDLLPEAEDCPSLLESSFFPSVRSRSGKELSESFESLFFLSDFLSLEVDSVFLSDVPEVMRMAANAGYCQNTNGDHRYNDQLLFLFGIHFFSSSRSAHRILLIF